MRRSRKTKGNIYRSFSRYILRFLPFVAPVLVFVVVWSPEISHYHVENNEIEKEVIEEARRFPQDSVLNELSTFNFGLALAWKSDEELVLAAEKILQGRVEIPGYPYTSLRMPFAVEDIDKGPPGWQLALASFIVPRILLDAYQATGRDIYLFTARDVIGAWALYERSACIPKGFLWNDHAIAARVPVITNFWRLYRNHPGYQPDVVRDIFQLLARSGELLAGPSRFTVATNHGIMQNLALWHLCVAFPSLPNIDHYRQVALNRLLEQMTFYVNNEGVVLEHSAGYHLFGVELIGMTFRYLTLQNLTIPECWRRKYQLAKDFYAQLRWPDGSLPKFGDTGDTKKARSGPLVTNVGADRRSEALCYQKTWIPKQLNSLYPVAGYSIWWNGLHEWPNVQKLTQTVVIWSHFPGHGHKHADEMSVLLRAAGETWWTNVGYWPSGVRGRSEAESWNGSNAPHLLNEKAQSERHTSLSSYGWSDDLALIDLQRRGPDQYVARRQVVHVKPQLWIVLDSTSGRAHSRSITTWTASHNVELTEGNFAGSYYLKRKNKNVCLTTFFIASQGSKIAPFEESFTPFAGWEVVDSIPESAPAIVVEQPANNSWAAAIWLLEKAIGPTFQPTAHPAMQKWEDAEKWQILVPHKSGSITVSRKGNLVHVKASGAKMNNKELRLIKGPEIGDELSQIRLAYETAARKYPKFRDLLYYRWKVSYILISLFVLQGIFFLICVALKIRYRSFFQTSAVLGWAGLGVWLVFFYLK